MHMGQPRFVLARVLGLFAVPAGGDIAEYPNSAQGKASGLRIFQKA
jgi:hypothetical protein